MSWRRFAFQDPRCKLPFSYHIATTRNPIWGGGERSARRSMSELFASLMKLAGLKAPAYKFVGEQ